MFVYIYYVQKHEKDMGTQNNSAGGHMEHCFAVFKNTA